jgi:hypothetical protein
VKARIWFAPADSLHGRVWVWHVRGLPPFVRSTRRHWGWERSWAAALAACLSHMKEHTT